MSIQNKVETVEKQLSQPAKGESSQNINLLDGDDPDRRSYRDAQEGCESI